VAISTSGHGAVQMVAFIGHVQETAGIPL